MILNDFQKIKHKSLLIIFLIFIIFSLKNNFFYNIYLILKKNSHERMIYNYGYCYPMGYGFIKSIKKKYNLEKENINIRNNEIRPSSSIFLFKINSNKSNKEILLNFKDNEIKNINNNFILLEKYENCYLIEYTND